MGRLAAGAGGWSEPEERRALALWMALGLLLILIAAVRSVGFHNADEHFQVLEFAGAKLGVTPWSALTWEYRCKMRPWLQPGLYTLGARVLAGLGIDDPFEWAFAFRLFSGLMAFLGLVGLALCCGRWFAEPATRRLAIRALVLTYFVPYLAVRTSAESLSTSCLVLALSLIVLGGNAAAPGVCLFTGVLLGLAASLRYATAVMVVFVLAWLVLLGGTPAKRLLWMLLGIAAALVLTLVVDRWGYGEWVLAPWNYAYYNFGENRAALEFGALPWYGYLLILTHGPFAPLDLLLAGVLVTAWVRHPRHMLTWATAPLALVHCAIAHKELRFLFPIAMLSPVLLALALAGVAWRGWMRALAGVVIAFNLVGLTALCALPAEPQVAFLGFVAERFPSGLEAFMASPTSPWVWHELPMYFYGPPPGLRAWPGTQALVADGVTRFDLVASAWDAPPSTDPYACRPIYRSVPDWLARGRWAAAVAKPPAAAWDLLRCKRSLH